MALLAVAADKGAPGVTTACVALAAVWPRPVLLAECDPAGGDLVYRLPAAGGGRLNPEIGLVSLAVAARRGLEPHQVWEHTQKLRGGLDVLTGVTTHEQSAGLGPLWGAVGSALSRLPHADVLADCGRIGADGPHYDLLARSSSILLVTRAALADVVRLRERVAAVAAALRARQRPDMRIDVVAVADRSHFHRALAEVGEAIGPGPARVVGGLAYEPRSAQRLRGEWAGNTRLDKSLLMRTARDIAGNLAASLPPMTAPEPGGADPPVIWAAPAGVAATGNRRRARAAARPADGGLVRDRGGGPPLPAHSAYIPAHSGRTPPLAPAPASAPPTPSWPSIPGPGTTAEG